MGITQTMCTNCQPQYIFYLLCLLHVLPLNSVTNLGGKFFQLSRAIVVILSTWDAETGLLSLCDVVWRNVDLVRETLVICFSSTWTVGRSKPSSTEVGLYRTAWLSVSTNSFAYPLVIPQVDVDGWFLHPLLPTSWPLGFLWCNCCNTSWVFTTNILLAREVSVN